MKSMLSLDSYQRITSNNNYLPEIDGLRFIAIFTVLLLHINTNLKRIFIETVPSEYNNSILDKIFVTSGLGVELFFAISGYILIIPFLRYWRYGGPPVNVKSYFKRRLSRLEPPFIISLLLIYAGNLIIKNFTFQESFSHFLATLFYSHMFIYGTWSNINPVTWSLETEVQFYIIAPLLAMLFAIRKGVFYWLIIFTLFLISVCAVGHPIIKELNLTKSIIPSLQWFLVGIIYADIQLRFPDWAIKPTIASDIFAWLSLPILYFTKMYAGNVIYDFCMLLFFICAFKSIFFKQFICNKYITTIGGMCYTIYLLHYALIYLTMNLLRGIQLNNFYLLALVIFVICLGVILLVSFVFFRFFERPFMKKDWIENLRIARKPKLSPMENTIIPLEPK